MATQLYVVHQYSDGVRYVVEVPGTITLQQLSGLASIDPEKDGWRVTGAAPTDGSTPPGLNTSCGTVTPPPVDNLAPTWLLANLPGAAANGEYSVALAYDTVGQAHSGQTITGISYTGGIPSWLIPGVSVSTRTLSLHGTPPTGTTSFSITLTLVQSDGKTKAKTFTVATGAVALYLVARYNPADDRISVFAGADAGENNLPTLTDTDALGGVAREQMRYFGANVADLETRYIYNSARSPAKGLHVFKLEQLAQTKYGSLTIANADTGYQVIALSDTPPVVTPPPAAVGAVIAVDAQWIRTKAGDPWGENRVYAWFNVSRGDDLVLYWKSKLFGENTGIGEQLATGNLRRSGLEKGYTHEFDVNTVTADTMTYRFKAKGQPDSSFQEISFNVPGGASLSTQRIQIFPAGTVDSTPPPTGTGGSAGIAAQQIVLGGGGLFTPIVQWSGQNARIANGNPPSVPSGFSLYYWTSGQQPTTSLPTSYDYKAGDEVGIMASLVPNSVNPNDGTNWTGKGWTNVTIGPAPSTVTN